MFYSKNLLILVLQTVLLLSLCAQPDGKYILVDQFGYRPDAKKVAIIRSPEVGFDKNEKYYPGQNYALIDASTGQEIFSGEIISYRSGLVDIPSGDKVWWFDFSQIKKDGTYFIKDKTTNHRSFTFDISKNVYNNVLKAAFKTFYYQRAGYEKKPEFAGTQWADGASHIGPLQDKNCRSFFSKGSSSSEKDLSGGWYDAGDYNKYTPWHANYIVEMLRMYKENPGAWSDDFGIPESNNGIPDILDEVVFGLEWLKKMQQNNGSCLSVMGLSSASPPSAATGQSLYGNASTYATLCATKAFALAAYVFKDVPQLKSTSSDLIQRAMLSWSWAEANPSVLFDNNSSSNNTKGLAAGNQETNDLGRLTAKVGASLFLYLVTEDDKFKNFFEANYDKLPLILWNNYVSQYFFEQQNILLEYLSIPKRNSAIAERISSATKSAFYKSGDFGEAILSEKSPYRSFLKEYNWGSNQYHANYGNFFNLFNAFKLDTNNEKVFSIAAEDYIHYIHGVNPLSIVFLSNMKHLGADRNVTQFYHTWFGDKTKWDQNPAPGFLVGGPNQFYNKDGCCPSSCGSTNNNALCNSEDVSTLIGQPQMKSYKDFNTSWPLNSWSVTENSNGYQVAYLRLLSKYVSTASITKINEIANNFEFSIQPNPANHAISIHTNTSDIVCLQVFDNMGRLCKKSYVRTDEIIDIKSLIKGVYHLKVTTPDGRNTAIKKLAVID